MNLKSTILAAAMCISVGAYAQNQNQNQPAGSPDTPTAGQSAKSVGEPYPAADSSARTAADNKRKSHKSAKAKAADCAAGHTDGNANTVAGSSDAAMTDCPKVTK